MQYVMQDEEFEWDDDKAALIADREMSGCELFQSPALAREGKYAHAVFGLFA